MTDTDTLLDRARTALREGDLRAAHSACRLILNDDPRHTGALELFAMTAMQAGKPVDAARLFERLVQLRPEASSVWNNYGGALAQTGRIDDALTAFRRAVAADPDDAAAQNNLGSALRSTGDLAGAVDAYRAAIVAEPDYVEAHANLGVALRKVGDLDGALAMGARAVALAPDNAEAQNNLGTTRFDRGELAAAVGAYEAALTSNPGMVEARRNLARTHAWMGKVDESLAYVAAVLAAYPEDAEAHLITSHAHFLEGDMRSAWSAYEWRYRTDRFAAFGDELTSPRWQGEDVRGKTVLVRAEQGFGDAIQFARYVPELAARAGSVIFDMRTELVDLMRTLESAVDITEQRTRSGDEDLHVGLMSLPHLLDLEDRMCPVPVPYLHAYPARTAVWRDRLGPGRKIGITWAGNPHHPLDRVRTIDPDMLAPLWAVDGVDWVSLQHDAPAPPGVANIVGDLSDFADTAAVIANLDLVIAVDSAVAHLAGALGAEVWMLLPTAHEWRWPVTGDGTGWYPSMRIWRQSTPGDWSDVIAAVATELAGRR